MSGYTANHKFDYRDEYGDETFEMRTMIEAGMCGWSGAGSKSDMKNSLAFTVFIQSFAIEHGKSNPEEVDHLS